MVDKSPADIFLQYFEKYMSQQKEFRDMDRALTEDTLKKFMEEFRKFLEVSKVTNATAKEMEKAMNDLKSIMKSLPKLTGTTAMTTAKRFVNTNLEATIKGDSNFFNLNSDHPRMKEALKALDGLPKQILSTTQMMDKLNVAGARLASVLGQIGQGVVNTGKGIGRGVSNFGNLITNNANVGKIVKGVSNGFTRLIAFLGSGGFFKKISGAIFDALYEANLVKNALKDTLRLLFLLAGSWVRRFFTNLLSKFMPREAAEKWGGIAGGATFLGLSSAPWLFGSKLFKGGVSGGLGGIGSALFRTPRYQTMTSNKAWVTLEDNVIFRDKDTGDFKKIVKGQEKILAKSGTARAAKLLKGTKGGLGPLGIALSAAAEIPALFQAKEEGRFGAQLAESTGGVGGAIAGGMAGAMFGPIGIAIGAMLGDWIGRTLGKGFGKYMAPIGQNLKQWFQSLGRIVKSMGPLLTLLGKLIKVALTPIRLTFMALSPVLKVVGSTLGWVVNLFTKIAASVTKWLAPAFETLGKWIDNLNRAIDTFMGDHPVIAKALGLEPNEKNGGADYSAKNPGDTNSSGYGRGIFKGETFDGRKITSKYGEVSGTHATGHKGVDLAYKSGEKVGAKIGGKVLYTGYDKNGYGNFAVIEDDKGYKHYYGHMASMGVKVGDTLKAGSTIGIAGSTGHSTGTHLHYEVRKPGQQNYLSTSNGYDVDPLAYVEKYREEEKKKKEDKKENKQETAWDQWQKSAYNRAIKEQEVAQNIGAVGTSSAAASTTGSAQFANDSVRGGLLTASQYNK